MTDVPQIPTYNQVTMPTLQEFQSYLPTAFSDNLTLLQKVNMVIQTLQSMGVSVNDLFNQWNTVVIPYVTGGGLNQDVVNQLTAWQNDGTLNNIITQTLNTDLGDITTLTTVDKTNVVNAINEVNSNKADKTLGGLDRLASTSKFITTLSSFIGLINTAYPTDNGTRFYLLPKAPVTTGVGGVLKIFGDDYQNNADYRDFGIYFHADQNGDKGYYGNGVNWLNVKVLDGGKWAGKHPDLGFSFQDGAVIAGRITCYNNTRAMWVFGSSLSTLQGMSLIAEFQNDIGFIDQKGIQFVYDVANTKANSIKNDTDHYLKESLGIGKRTFINGQNVGEVNQNNHLFKNAVVMGYQPINTGISTPSVKTGNVFVVSNGVTTSITDFVDGIAGQQITLVINDNVTTIKNNSSIKLKGNIDFKPTNLLSNLTLTRLGTQWIETNRTEF